MGAAQHDIQAAEDKVASEASSLTGDADKLETMTANFTGAVTVAVYSTRRGVPEPGWLPNVKRLVLACMDSYDSEKRRIL